MPRKKLTDQAVQALKTTRTQEDFWDTLTPALHVRVSGTTNRKTWLVRYRANGKQRRMKLGTYPAVSLAEARSKARDELALVDEGRDPVSERRESDERRTTNTFRAMADEVLKALEPHTREATRLERKRILAKELLPAWGDRPAAEITRRDVVQLVEKIANRGAPVMANRTLALVKVLYAKALARGFPTVQASPAQLLEPPGVEQGRDRYLTAPEVAALWRATAGQPELTRGAVRLALLTGQRIGSVLAMQRDKIDGDIWTIPAEHFKGNRTQLVPLSEQARAVLGEIPEIAETEGSWVFPSRDKAAKPYLTNLGKALTRIRKATKISGKPIPHYTIHDLRTTFRTWATRAGADGGLGVAPNVADAVLGHAENTLGWSRYTGDRERYLLHERREALRAWGAWVAKAVAE
jgi:integrase